MSELGQTPLRAQDAAFLNQGSVVGRKVDFVDIAVASTYATISISAGALATPFRISAALYDPLVPTALRTSQNLIVPDDCIVFYYVDFYVDNDNTDGYQLAVGSSLSAAQKLVWLFSDWDEKTPFTGTSQSHVYQFFNNDVSSHIVYAHVSIKYIITK